MRFCVVLELKLKPRQRDLNYESWSYHDLSCEIYPLCLYRKYRRVVRVAVLLALEINSQRKIDTQTRIQTLRSIYEEIWILLTKRVDVKKTGLCWQYTPTMNPHLIKYECIHTGRVNAINTLVSGNK